MIARNRADRRSLVLPAVVLAVAVALGLAAATGGSDGDDGPPTTSPSEASGPQEGPSPDASAPGEAAPDDQVTATLRALERREAGDPLAIGDVDAPLTMVQWADFQCPYCRRFAVETEPELIDRYVEPGLLRIEWRDLPLIGEESLTAALAGRAAAEQGAFWEFHHAVYAQELERDAGHLDEEGVVTFAEEIGLDVEAFVRDLDDERLLERVAEDAGIARELGITGTPAFLLDGQPLLGGQPTEVFVDAIESSLEDADVDRDPAS